MTETIPNAAQMTVELISAQAACDATSGPPEDTLLDLALSPEIMRRAMSRLEDPVLEPPTATELFGQKEDGFVSALAVSIVPGEWRERRRLAVVTRPFGFLATLGKERIAIIAPTRFETDFASIPSVARWLISPFGRHAEAAVIHDWLYALGPEGDRIARRRADRIFRIALKRVGVGFLLRTIMFLAVRVGGKRAFGRGDGLRFRSLGSLDLIDPPPAREPYLRTVASKPVRKT
ncbi:MAG: DUF1353 domain-containing protein [Pseudomonadota bacterium]